MVQALSNFLMGRGYAVLNSPMQNGLVAPYLRASIVRTPRALIEQGIRRRRQSSGLSPVQEAIMGVSHENDEARGAMSHEEATALYWSLKASVATEEEYIAGAMWRHAEMEATAVATGDDLIDVARLNIQAVGMSALAETLTHNSSLFEKGIVDRAQYRFIPQAVLEAGLQTFWKRPSEMTRVPELSLGVFVNPQASDGTEISELAKETTRPDVYDGIEKVRQFLTEQAGGTVKTESVYREVWKAISQRPGLVGHSGPNSQNGNATIHLSNFRIDDGQVIGTVTLERRRTTPLTWQIYLVRFQEGKELDRTTREMVHVYSPIFSTKEPRGSLTARPRSQRPGSPLLK